MVIFVTPGTHINEQIQLLCSSIGLINDLLTKYRYRNINKLKLRVYFNFSTDIKFNI